MCYNNAVNFFVLTALYPLLVWHHRQGIFYFSLALYSPSPARTAASPACRHICRRSKSGLMLSGHGLIPSYGIYPVVLYYCLADAYTALHGRMRVSTQQIYLARPIAPVRPTKDIQQAALVQARHLSDIIRKCLVYLLVRPVWSIGIAECRRHPNAAAASARGIVCRR